MKTNLDRLIEILCDERGERCPENLTEKEKADCFRALCNVREPRAVTQEFLELQNEYLSMLAANRGVVDVRTFNYTDNIALWQGDITRLNADAIVNACNSALLGCFQPLHSCIDNVIHSNAGVQVRLDCHALMQGGKEPNGKCKVTKGYNLPSKYILHTVGCICRGEPTRENQEDLRNCYISCLDKAKEMGLKTIAFCCISTGVYGYPKDAACRLAVATVKEWLKCGYDVKVVFNVFLDEDKYYYERELSSENR